MAKFDPKKADLNKDGKLSDYEENVGKKRAAAMKMGHSPKKMDHAMKMDKSPMYNYKKGYAMKMGSKEIDSPSAFNMKDAKLIEDSPMMKTDPGDTPNLESMERDVSLEQIKHYYPGSKPYYIGTVKRDGPHGDELGSYKGGDYIPGTHDFMDYAQLRDMSKMTGADTAARQGSLGAKRLAGVLRRARSLSGMTYSYADPEHTRRMAEKDPTYKPVRKMQYLDSETREAFKGSRYAMDQVKKSEEMHKYLQEQMKIEFEGLPKMKTKGPTFNKLKGNVLTSLPAGVPKVTFDGGKTKKRKGKTGVGKFLSKIGDAVSDINISLPKKTKRSKGSNRGPQGGVNPRRRNRAAARNRRR